MNSIVIIGGGPAGLALAAGLSNFKENNITIIEKTNYDCPFSGEHVQSQILPILDQLKIPQEIVFDNSTSCEGILGNWGGTEINSSGLFNLYGSDFILHRPEFEKSLSNYLKTKGVIFKIETKVGKIDKYFIEIQDELFAYDYIFDCSGRSSRQFDNKRLIFDNLLGISFHSYPPIKNVSKIILESVENGWWYYTFNRNTAITTFFTDRNFYNSSNRNLQKELDKTKFIKHYSKNLQGPSISRPAYTSILKNNPSKIKQIGDAYFSLDPLSSQGIYKAFSQAITISKLFDQPNFEEIINDFYINQQRIFFQHLKFREYYYKKAFDFHKTEFYKKRIELSLLS